MFCSEQKNDKKNCQKVLTTKLVNDSIGYDKKSCHYPRNYFSERRCEMPLYNRLKEYRSRLGVNQQEMGRLVGTSRQTISQIERGDYSPSVTLALKIARVCEVSVEDIFTYEEDEESE